MNNTKKKSKANFGAPESKLYGRAFRRVARADSAFLAFASIVLYFSRDYQGVSLQ